TPSTVIAMVILDPNYIDIGFIIADTTGVLGSSNPNITFIAPLKGIYYIAVLGYFGTASYTLRINITDVSYSSDNNNQPSEASQAPQTLTSDINPFSDPYDFYYMGLGLLPSTSQQEVGVFNLTPLSTGSYVLTVFYYSYPPEDWPGPRKLIPNLTYTKSIDFDPNVPDAMLQIAMGASKNGTGRYYVRVSPNLAGNDTNLNYKLNSTRIVMDYDNNNIFDYATQITTPSIQNDSVHETIDDSDYYKMNCSANATLNVSLRQRNGGYISSNIYIYGPDKKEIANTSEQRKKTKELKIALPNTGTYYVAVILVAPWDISLDSFEDYTLTIEQNLPPILAEKIPAQHIDEDSETDQLIDLNRYFIDPDKDVLKYSVSYNEKPEKLSLRIEKERYLAAKAIENNWTGNVGVRVKAIDKYNATVESNLFYINVTPVNDAPVLINAPSKVTLNEDENITINVTFYDSDSNLTYSYESDKIKIEKVEKENITQFKLIPELNWYGEETIAIIASDGIANASAKIKVSVLAVDDPPLVIVPKGYNIEMNENIPYNLSLSQVLVDIDSTLNYTINVDFGDITFKREDDILRIIPETNWSGKAQLTIDAIGEGKKLSLTIPITVAVVNDPPIIHPIPEAIEVSMKEGDKITFSVEVTDDGLIGNLKFLWFFDDIKLNITTRKYEYTAGYDTSGKHKMKISVSDEINTVYYEWNLTIDDVNRKPVDVKITLPVNGSRFKEGKKIMFKASGKDPDDDNLTYKWYEDTEELGVGESLNITLKIGKHTITVEVSDGKGGIEKAQVMITVIKEEKPIIPCFGILILIPAVTCLVTLGRRNSTTFFSSLYYVI
ncbi:MAG: pre-peptidase C-terminal domain-containing protein, partial [Candidatus Thermoplasmatota archaeon]